MTRVIEYVDHMHVTLSRPRCSARQRPDTFDEKTRLQHRIYPELVALRLPER